MYDLARIDNKNKLGKCLKKRHTLTYFFNIAEHRGNIRFSIARQIGPALLALIGFIIKVSPWMYRIIIIPSRLFFAYLRIDLLNILKRSTSYAEFQKIFINPFYLLNNLDSGYISTDQKSEDLARYHKHGIPILLPILSLKHIVTIHPPKFSVNLHGV